MMCMLLAMLDLAMGGGLRRNLIADAPPLLGRYRLYFDAVRRDVDHPNAYVPFFHLAGRLRGGAPSFWHLVPLPGRVTAMADRLCRGLHRHPGSESVAGRPAGRFDEVLSLGAGLTTHAGAEPGHALGVTVLCLLLQRGGAR